MLSRSKSGGTGRNTLGVVKEAISLKNNDDYDHVWCVFDRDSFPAKLFTEAIDVAKRNGIKVQVASGWHFYYLSVNKLSLSTDSI
jgi:hypothetical protein